VSTSRDSFPPDFFRRADETGDEQFYRQPRFVTHIDRATIEALTQVYREIVPAGGRVLDLMSSWVSHLPADVEYERVSGLGMNRDELAGNPRLHDFEVHDLNRRPELPYGDAEFDAVVNAVSVQYLTRPLEVFAAVRRVLRPGGLHAVAISHRLFPQKAVAVWQALSREDRVALVGSYFALTPGWEQPRVLDRSPSGADPLWVVFARRVEEDA
jgi:SAM-dependent methyltransferase